MTQEEVASEKTHQIHRVPAENLPALRNRIEALQKRAFKIGCQPVELQVSEPVKVLVPVRDLGDPNGGPMRDNDGKVVTRTRIYYDVEVKGEAPKYAGWTLVAALTHLAADGDNAAAMLLRMVPGQTLPESWRRADQKCDHCGLVRKRNETFVVRHDDGTLKQIGRQCIADFLGHQDPEGMLAAAEYLFSADGAACGAEDDGSFGGKVGVVWLEEYLSWVAVTIRVGGWLSRSKARDQGGFATADRAFNLMVKKEADRTKEDPRPADEDLALAKAAIDWARKDLAAKPEKNDYEHNLSVVCTRDAVDTKAFGIAASLISAYRREMGVRTEREIRREREAKSVFFGEVGKREVFELTVVKLIDCEGGQFGPVKLHKFFDQNGNVAAWFSTGAVMELGKTYRVRATVKAHEEYNGVKQTMLTRCAVDDEWYCPACRATNTPDAKDQKAVCECGVAKGSWVCLNCRKVNGPEAKICECGHDLKSWLCSKCHTYNTRKIKVCQVINCGTPKKAWPCMTWQCGKWNDEKIEVCACGADKTGAMRIQAAPGA